MHLNRDAFHYVTTKCIIVINHQGGSYFLSIINWNFIYVTHLQGEDIFVTATREVKEETGVSVSILVNIVCIL